MYKERQGYLLRSTTASALQDRTDIRIADLATGTGIWAFDVSRLVPQAVVVGLDISGVQFPPRWTWPANVSLNMMHITKDVPDTYQGAFDIVHIRLLLPCGPQIGSNTYLNQLAAMLKPGGWLQLDELAYPTSLAGAKSVSSDIVHQKDLSVSDEMLFFIDWVSIGSWNLSIILRSHARKQDF